jgi:glycosyltransferase involved in cell wall biosynthesis
LRGSASRRRSCSSAATRASGRGSIRSQRRGGSRNRQVFLAGWRTHEQLPQALNAADALVLPSVAEAFGLVLVEAMACGVPVIASRAPGPAAIVADGATGWLIPPDDEDALVKALVDAARGQEERRAPRPTRTDRQPPLRLGEDRP